jgi:hypothetical protein
MGHRVTQARQQFAIVAEDVAIVHRDHARLVAGQHVAEANPHVAAFAARAGAELGVVQLLEQLLHARAIVPQQHRALGQLLEKPPRLAPFARAGRAVYTHHDLFDVGDAFEFAGDAVQRRSPQLADVARQNERHRRFLRKFFQLPFQAWDIMLPQSVQRGNGTGLKEI